MRVILQPCGSDASKNHYDDTIDDIKVDIDDLKPYITTKEYNDLLQIYPNKNCKIWGIKEGNRKKWEKIDKGDVSLFSGDNKIFSSAIVTYKMINEELAEFLWGRDIDGSTWKCIYFLDELQELDVSYSTFNKIVGYKQNYIIRGFSILDEDKSNKFIDTFSLESNRYFSNDVSYEEYSDIIDSEDELSKLNAFHNLDVIVKTTQRREQSFLRNQLFGNKYVGRCSICGKEIPVEFLWCSHIKKRKLCTNEEKLDYKNIVTPMCKFGCDDLYEKGFIGVRDGIVEILKRANNKCVDEYLNSVENKKCLGYNEHNKKYYDAHLKINGK